MISGSDERINMTPDDLNMDDLLDIRFLDKTYQEAIELTQVVATYLERESEIRKGQEMASDVKIIYACESMRITTCLMQVVSWLLVQKGVASGEMTKEEASVEKFRLGAREVCLAETDVSHEQVADDFKKYLNLAQQLYHRIARMDEMLYGAHADENPVHKLFERINSEENP